MSNDSRRRFDARFYRYIERGSQQSALVVCDLLQRVLPAPLASVLDVGCGAGAWLTAFSAAGCRVHGIDGAHVDADCLLIDRADFEQRDLGQPFDLGRRFDLVLCLEVAEHLPDAAAGTLVDSLCRHSALVLFSAAPPGQGGTGHVNEQPYAYWRALFAARGYRMYDTVRKSVSGDRRVSPWYRYNAFLFVDEAAMPAVQTALAADRVAEAGEVPDVAPLPYRWRRRLIATLPEGLVTWLADTHKTLRTLRRARD